jgi:hypothetical protein
LGLLLPRDVGHDFLLSGLLLVDMNAELIDLENKASLAEENSWTRLETSVLEPASESVSALQQRLSRESWEYVRSHDWSPLND